jgi:predicted NAD-dependent protein-ADP-ribosyltransferase YbiA (DUF1768 family)
MSRYNPDSDGIDHVNVYSGGRTELGRFLSNFSRSPVDTVDGKFASIEGYWYWLGTDDSERERLRKAVGFAAKKIGRQLGSLDYPRSSMFRLKIAAAIMAKLLSNERMAELLTDNTLPLAHYYVFGGRVIEPKSGKWVLEVLHMCEELLKQGPADE